MTFYSFSLLIFATTETISISSGGKHHRPTKKVWIKWIVAIPFGEDGMGGRGEECHRPTRNIRIK